MGVDCLQNYFRDSWNVFDFITVVGSVVDVIVTERDVRNTCIMPRFHLTSMTTVAQTSLNLICCVPCCTICRTHTKSKQVEFGFNRIKFCTLISCYSITLTCLSNYLHRNKGDFRSVDLCTFSSLLVQQLYW